MAQIVAPYAGREVIVRVTCQDEDAGLGRVAEDLYPPDASRVERHFTFLRAIRLTSTFCAQQLRGSHGATSLGGDWFGAARTCAPVFLDTPARAH